MEQGGGGDGGGTGEEAGSVAYTGVDVEAGVDVGPASGDGAGPPSSTATAAPMTSDELWRRKVEQGGDNVISVQENVVNENRGPASDDDEDDYDGDVNKPRRIYGSDDSDEDDDFTYKTKDKEAKESALDPQQENEADGRGEGWGELRTSAELMYGGDLGASGAGGGPGGDESQEAMIRRSLGVAQVPPTVAGGLMAGSYAMPPPTSGVADGGILPGGALVMDGGGVGDGGPGGAMPSPDVFTAELAPDEGVPVLEPVDIQPLTEDEIFAEEEEGVKGVLNRFSRKEKWAFVGVLVALVAGLGVGLGVGLPKAGEGGTASIVTITTVVPRQCNMESHWRQLGRDLTHPDWWSRAKRPGYVTSISRAFGAYVSLSDDGSVLAVTGKFSDGVSVFRLQNVTADAEEEDLLEEDSKEPPVVATPNEGNATEDNGTTIDASNIDASNVLLAVSSDTADPNGTPLDGTELNATNFNSTNTTITTVPHLDWVKLGGDIIDGPVLFGRESDFYEAVSATIVSGDGKRVAASFPHYTDDVFKRRGLVKVYEWEEKEGAEAGWKPIGEAFLGHDKNVYLGDKNTFDLSHDGGIIAISNYRFDSKKGRVQVFRFEGEGDSARWRQMGEDLVGFAAGDEIGQSISLSADGTVLAVGTSYTNTQEGSATVYRFTESEGWTPVGNALTGRDHNACGMGDPVKLSADGTRVAVWSSMPREGSSTRCIDWVESATSNGEDLGQVRVYELASSTEDGDYGWVQVSPDFLGDEGGLSFGWALGLSGDGKTVTIGAAGGKRNGVDSGYVVTYHENPDGNWTRVGKDINGTASAYWAGDAVAISYNGTVMAVGSPLDFLLPASRYDSRPQDTSGVASVYHHCLL